MAHLSQTQVPPAKRQTAQHGLSTRLFIVVGLLLFIPLAASAQGSPFDNGFTALQTEAEAVAFVVCQSVGLKNGTASQDYIQLWHGDANLLRESLEAVQQTATVILGRIAP